MFHWIGADQLSFSSNARHLEKRLPWRNFPFSTFISILLFLSLLLQYCIAHGATFQCEWHFTLSVIDFQIQCMSPVQWWYGINQIKLINWSTCDHFECHQNHTRARYYLNQTKPKMKNWMNTTKDLQYDKLDIRLNRNIK